MQCHFEICANFPKKKRHVLSKRQLTLFNDMSFLNVFKCGACWWFSNGFRYNYNHGFSDLDVRCSSIPRLYIHESHAHSLYFISPQCGFCKGCSKHSRYVFRCIRTDCEFALNFKCDVLPKTVKHKYDEHPLSLCYGERAGGQYWCDICETKTDPETWFYMITAVLLCMSSVCLRNFHV